LLPLVLLFLSLSLAALPGLGVIDGSRGTPHCTERKSCQGSGVVAPGRRRDNLLGQCIKELSVHDITPGGEYRSDVSASRKVR
jgi:hypothetical protein